VGEPLPDSVQQQQQQQERQRWSLVQASQQHQQQHDLHLRPREATVLPRPLQQHGQLAARDSLQQQQQQAEQGEELLLEPDAAPAPEAEASLSHLVPDPAAKIAAVAAAGAAAAPFAAWQASMPGTVHVACWQEDLFELHEQLGLQQQQDGHQKQEQQEPQQHREVPEEGMQKEFRAVAFCDEPKPLGQVQHMEQQQQQQEQEQQQQPGELPEGARACQQLLLQQQQQAEEQQQQPQLHPQEQHGQLQQLQQLHPYSSADLSSTNDNNADKQQQLLARLCAKHGLPLPHPRHLGPKQQAGGLWDPREKQQQVQRLTQRGGEVAKQRGKLLQQLRDSSISRRRPGRPQAGVVHESRADQTAGQQLKAAEGAARSAATAAAVAERSPSAVPHTHQQVHEQQQQQQQEQLAGQSWLQVHSQPVSGPAAATQLHLVDGLQYVHALLGSIKMPSASLGAEQLAQPDTQPAGESLVASVQQQEQQQQQQSQVQPEQQQDPQDPGQQQQQQQPLRLQLPLVGPSAAQLQALCTTALAKLRQVPPASEGSDSACARSTPQQQQQQQPANLMPVQDALVLLCMADSQHQRHNRQQQQQPGGCFVAVHATVQQHMRAARVDSGHKQPTPGWHLQQQEQQSLQGVLQLCWHPRQLCIRAVRAVAAARQGWLDEELQPLSQCLHEVRRRSVGFRPSTSWARTGAGWDGGTWVQMYSC